MRGEAVHGYEEPFMWWRFPHNPTAYDDDWEVQPTQGPFHKWGLGVVIPLVILGFGIHAIVTRQAEYGSRVTMIMYGLNAVALGIAGVSAALFLTATISGATSTIRRGLRCSGKLSPRVGSSSA
jgi:hypothetical protein